MHRYSRTASHQSPPKAFCKTVTRVFCRSATLHGMQCNVYLSMAYNSIQNCRIWLEAKPTKFSSCVTYLALKSFFLSLFPLLKGC